MNFDIYRHELPFPMKEQFTTTWYYKQGKVVARRDVDGTVYVPQPGCWVPWSDAVPSFAVKEDEFAEAAYRQAVKAYNEEEAGLLACFRKDLFWELDITTNPRREQLFQMAWDRGHAAGYEEVFAIAEDLAALIR